MCTKFYSQARDATETTTTIETMGGTESRRKQKASSANANTGYENGQKDENRIQRGERIWRRRRGERDERARRKKGHKVITDYTVNQSKF